MGPGANDDNNLAAPLWQQQSLSLSCNQYALWITLPAMQLLVQCQVMLLHACTTLQNAAQSTPCSLAMWLKNSSKKTTFSPPLL